MRFPIALHIIAFIMLLCGCTTVESSCIGGHHMILIKNSGWNLFSVVPLASGNTRYPNANSSLFFENTVNLTNNIAILDQTVRQIGARGYKNVTNTIKDENVFLILLTRRIYHTSAELVFDGAHAQ